MKQNGKTRNYIFTVSLYSTSNRMTPIFEDTIWAEVRIWKNKWQLEDMSYLYCSAVCQWHLQHTPADRDAPRWTAVQESPLPPETFGSDSLSCLYSIHQNSFFFWNISGSIGVQTFFVPIVIFHILLLKPGKVNEFNLKEINILSTCTEVYHLNIQSAQRQFSAKASLLISSWYFFQTLNPMYLIKLSKILLSQIPLKPPSQHSGFTSASTQRLSSHYCSHISKDKYRSKTKLKPNGEWDDSPCIRLDFELACASNMKE